MEWQEALESVIANGGPEEYRVYCDAIHPRHEAWRAKMIVKAGGESPAQYPTIARQAASLAGAVGRAVVAAATGSPVRVPADVHAERLASCMGCEHNGAAPDGVHCRRCGCGGAKLHLATEACPVGRWARLEAAG